VRKESSTNSAGITPAAEARNDEVIEEEEDQQIEGIEDHRKRANSEKVVHKRDDNSGGLAKRKIEMNLNLI